MAKRLSIIHADSGTISLPETASPRALEATAEVETGRREGHAGLAWGDSTLAAAKPSGSGSGGGKPGGGDGSGLMTTYTSGRLDGQAGYDIKINFSGTWTAPLQQAFIDAADFLSKIILGDVADVTAPRRFATDDITISAELSNIDGVGGVLGQAGPTVWRTANFLPAAGTMQFDIADAQTYLDSGNWLVIVFHEMMHTLGFGTMWDQMGLLSGSVAGGDLVFTGENANAAYLAEFAALAAADGFAYGVPVETDGGSGTAGGHWDETTFVNEVMTGYIDPTNFLSTMTVAALEDMGYDTYVDGVRAGDLVAPAPVNLFPGTLEA
jgi:hypothetical protein